MRLVPFGSSLCSRSGLLGLGPALFLALALAAVAVGPGCTKVCEDADGNPIACPDGADDDATADDDSTPPDDDGSPDDDTTPIEDDDTTAPPDDDTTAPSDDDTTAAPVDSDSDGSPDDVDCDDENANVHPAAEEVCDGVDNDCDGGTDEGLATHMYFLDADTDTHGDAAVPTATCAETPPEGYVSNDDDCDDTDPDRYPGNPEICDGEDNDCTGGVPANEADGDGDGSMMCESDCDDTDPDRYPGNPEFCDGKDNDCSGAVPANEVDSDGDGFRVCAFDCDDADDTVNPAWDEICDGKDNDCSGAFPANEADADGDGYMVCESDCSDTDAARFPGNPETCDGKDNDCSAGVPPSEADADADGYRVCESDCEDGDPARNPGESEACNGIDDDCDGAVDDGFDVDEDSHTTCEGDCDDGAPAVHPGAAERCWGGVDDDCDGEADEGCGPQGEVLSAANAAWQFWGEPGSFTASALTTANLDADGYPEVVAGCPSDEPGGAVYLVEPGIPGVYDLADAAYARIGGPVDPDLVSFGDGLASAGSWGPGHPDDVLLVGGRCYDANCGDDLSGGAVFAWQGPLSGGDYSTDDAFLRVEGAGRGDQAGWAVAAVSDQDGDGVPDILIGAPNADEHGEYYYGKGTAFLLSGSLPAPGTQAVIDIPAFGDPSTNCQASLGCIAKLEGWNVDLGLGHGLAEVGPFEEGGPGWITVGAPASNPSESSSVLLFQTPIEGAVATEPDVRIVGLPNATYLGYPQGVGGRVAGLPDHAFGPAADLLLGASGDDELAEDGGCAYVVAGEAILGGMDLLDPTLSLSALVDEGNAVRFCSSAYQYGAGHAVASAGDVNGDSFTDVLVSSPGRWGACGSAWSGTAWLIYGGHGLTGTVDLDDVGDTVPGARIEGTGEYPNGDALGYAVAAGDVNLDGYSDVIVSAPCAEVDGTDVGAVYVFRGGPGDI